MSKQSRTSCPKRRPGLLMLAAALCPVGTAVGQDSIPEPPPGLTAARAPDPAEVDRLVVAMGAAQSTDAAREAAAARLIPLIGAESARIAITRALERDDPPGSRRAVAASLSQTVEPPAELLSPLIRGLDSATADVMPALLRALGRYRTKAAVRAVIDGVLAPGRPDPAPAVLSQALQTLAAQTGLVGFGSDLSRWRAWWSSAQWLPEAEWRRTLLNAQGEAAREARQERDAAARGLVDVLRRLHAAVPEEARSDLVVEMLAGAVPEARLLGLELTRRALLNARIPSDAVVVAVAARLMDPLPAARAAAASILERLDRPDLATRIMAALQQETDPEAASAMLRALARAPLVELPPVALRWLGAGSRSDAAAIEALEAASAVGLLIDPQIIDAVRAALNQRFPDLPPTGFRLMLDLGEGDRVTALLAGQDEVITKAAAEALTARAGAVDALVAAARQNPALFESAVRALMRHRPNAEGFGSAASLPATSAEQKTAALEAYARAIPVGELLKVARSESDLAMRESLLAAATSPEFFAQAEGLDERMDLAILLTRTRLEQGRAEAAIAVLDSIPSTMQGPRVISLRVAALLCLNRIEDAAAIAEPREVLADAWIHGLELSIDQPHAAAVLEQIETRFGTTLTAAQRQRVDGLAMRVPAREPEPVPAEPEQRPGP